MISGVLGFGGTAQAAVFSFTPADISVNTGTGTSTAGTSTLINTSTGVDGYNNFFTTQFSTLGGTASRTITNPLSIETGTTSADTSANRSALAITAGEVGLAHKISFNWAFKGSATAADTVTVSIVDSVSTVYFSQVFATAPGGYGNGLSTGTGVVYASGIAAGIDYYVQFDLNEQSGNGNSAFAFNNLTVETGVPFEFTPSLGIVSVAGVWGGLTLLKKLRQKSSGKV